jgi:hypothetical protein
MLQVRSVGKVGNPPGSLRTPGRNPHDEAKLELILKTRPEMHTKHCVLEKSFLDPLHLAK